MSKTLVAFFSASGVTKGAAQRLAGAIGADLYEIKPAVAYTRADLNWMDKKSRSTVEMNDSACRPALADRDADIPSYDRIFLGFPIWWYTAPSIIRTFLESYDFTGKTIVPFCTSGSSSIGGSAEHLTVLAADATWLEGARFNPGATQDEVAAWVEGLGV